jgi:hypothetical protein
MTLTPEDTRKFKDAFNFYAKNHPTPDEPIMGFACSKRFYSVREAADEMERDTEIGKKFLEIFAVGIEIEGIDKVVERFTKKSPTP